MREILSGGDVDRLIAAAAADTDDSLTLLGLTFGPGGGTPYRVAPAGVEVVKVVSGRVGVLAGGRRWECGPGAALVVDAPYRLENVGSDDASLVLVSIATVAQYAQAA